MKRHEFKTVDLEQAKAGFENSQCLTKTIINQGVEMSKTIEDYITKVCAEVDEYFYDPLVDAKEELKKTEHLGDDNDTDGSQTGTPVYDLNGDFIGYRTSVYKANHDVVTELPVLKLVVKRINVAMEQADLIGKKMAVLSIRFNHLEEIEWKYGERIANLILQQLASILKVVVRGSDTVGRAGDHQFVIVMTEMNSSQGIYRVINILQRLIAEPILVDDCMINVSANFGIAVYPDHEAEPEELYNYSTRALDIARSREENSFVFYETCD